MVLGPITIAEYWSCDQIVQSIHGFVRINEGHYSFGAFLAIIFRLPDYILNTWIF